MKVMDSITVLVKSSPPEIQLTLDAKNGMVTTTVLNVQSDITSTKREFVYLYLTTAEPGIKTVEPA